MKAEEEKANEIQHHNQAEEQKHEEVKADEEQKAEVVEKPKKRGGRKKAKDQVKVEKEEDLDTIGYFTRPVLVSALWDELDPAKQKKAVNVWAKGDYCYVLELTHQNQKANQLYSWGRGDSYVLGSREEDNQFKPYTVHPKMFEELPIKDMGLGTQHVVVLTTSSQDSQEIPDFEPQVLEFKLPTEQPKGKKTPAKIVVDESKKRKRSQISHEEEEEKKEVVKSLGSKKPTPAKVLVNHEKHNEVNELIEQIKLQTHK